jgi:hypothetical protein
LSNFGSRLTYGVVIMQWILRALIDTEHFLALPAPARWWMDLSAGDRLLP